MLIDDVKALRDRRNRLYDSELQVLLSNVVAHLEAERETVSELLTACERAAHEINRPDGTTGSAMAALKQLRAAVKNGKGAIGK